MLWNTKKRIALFFPLARICNPCHNRMFVDVCRKEKECHGLQIRASELDFLCNGFLPAQE